MKLFLGIALLFAAVQVQASGLEIRMAEQAHLVPATTQSCLSKARGSTRMDIRASFVSVPVTFVNNTDQFVAIDKIEMVVGSAARKNIGRVILTGAELEAMGLEPLAPGSYLEATCPLIAGNLRLHFSSSYFADVSVFAHSETRSGDVPTVESTKRITLIP